MLRFRIKRFRSRPLSVAARYNKMTTIQVIVGFKMLNGVFYSSLTKDDDMRLCGG